MSKKDLIIGMSLVHKHKGPCMYSKEADILERCNSDISSIFVKFPNIGIQEVSIKLIEKQL